MKELNTLPELEKNDYLNKGYDFWKEYRLLLSKILKEQKEEEQIVKTPENIIKMANEIGVKATARYFNINPSSVRYYKNRIK